MDANGRSRAGAVTNLLMCGLFLVTLARDAPKGGGGARDVGLWSRKVCILSYIPGVSALHFRYLGQAMRTHLGNMIWVFAMTAGPLAAPLAAQTTSLLGTGYSYAGSIPHPIIVVTIFYVPNFNTDGE